MKLNHLHICVPDVKAARAFFERNFGFTFAFAEHDGDLVFVRDEAGFLLTLHSLKAGDSVTMPSWFHFGFCLGDAAQVRAAYAALQANGVAIEQPLKEGKDWATFRCWAPGPYRLEVSWNG